MSAVPGGIAIISTSTLLSASDAADMVDAVAKQVREHFAPAWSRWPSTPTLYASPADVPARMARILLTDLDKVAGALAYHTEAGGVVMGAVGVSKILGMGGAVAKGSLSVSCALSHEVLEACANPFVNGWQLALDGRLWAKEVCDWVQEESYEIGGVAVSNFVCPEGFNPEAGVGDELDYLGSLTDPFSIAPGGYAMVMAPGGSPEQIGGLRPAWKLPVRAERLAVGASRWAA